MVKCSNVRVDFDETGCMIPISFSSKGAEYRIIKITSYFEDYNEAKYICETNQGIKTLIRIINLWYYI